MLPRPFQRPGIPLWLAARGEVRRPVRRAARFDGLFPIEVDPDGLSRMLDVVVEERGSLDGFDVAIVGRPGADVTDLAERGATWVMWAFQPGDGPPDILPFVEAGPPPAVR